MLGGKLSLGKKCVKSSGMRITGTRLIGWTQKLQRQDGHHIHSKYGGNFNFMCKNDILAIVPTQFVSGALF